MIEKFERKCVQIEALHFVDQDSYGERWDNCHIEMTVNLLTGRVNGLTVYDRQTDRWTEFKFGDWIVRGEHGEYYPLPDDIFKAMYVPVSGEGVFGKVIAERDRQLQLWGVQSHPSVHPRGARHYLGMGADEAIAITESRADAGSLTWGDIAFEEFAEALDADTQEARIEELIQLAAVIVSWIEAELR